MENEQLVGILEGALFAAGEPLSIQRLLQLFAEDEQPSKRNGNWVLFCGGREL